MPVHASRVDRIIGILDCLELLGVDPREPIGHFVRPVGYVPAARSIHDLLLDLRRERQVMTIVVDEYRGAEGIVTIEDIIEEVVEDIRDEYDEDEAEVQMVRKLGERDYLVSARIGLEALAEEIGIDLPDGGYNSLSGFLINKLRDMPSVGAAIDYQEITFTIERATPMLIQEVRVQW